MYKPENNTKQTRSIIKPIMFYYIYKVLNRYNLGNVVS